ncbi:LOW QUALITY PROTEIN: uncharacterized protein LOC129216724 [Uloborus diversus]|uniref:LOW QUALITY PROTEIN: uncharacterized protein LOC129216724 n=1 Tax=Uloborus diversus TaxID=327109 RepID=UPI002409F2EC|nr:LOW QUALITY PROTEIN: uncharacterized protein LOC129216724 [Uloborus diversus]
MIKHQFIESLKQTLDTGDREIRTWFLVENDYLPLILTAIYISFATVIGPALMKNRKPFVLRKLMIVFNLAIVVIYTINVYTIFVNLPYLGMHKFCKGTPFKKGDLTYELTSCCWVIYILKYVEYMDTVFFILRKKNHLVTFLHVIHHSVVPVFGWVMLRTERSGFQTIPVLLNACVHIMMYSYYGLAAIGPQMRKYLWWKKYLTQIQMVQFVLMILFVTVIAPLSGCTMMKASFAIDFIGAGMFLVLFYNFYKNNFQKKTAKIKDILLLEKFHQHLEFNRKLDIRHPIVQTWPFVRPDYLPFLMTASYLLFIKVIGPQLMKSQKPFGLRHLMIIYNFWLVIMYVGCVATIFYVFATTDMLSELCRKRELSQKPHFYKIAYAGWIIYLLKYAEYADTVFFVLRKKYHQITNLHLIHHAIVPIAIWTGLRTETCAFQMIPVIINSLVHVIMYSYYGLAALGPEIQKYLWWKKYITLMQMVQFVVIMLIYAVAHMINCATSTKILYFGVFLTSLFLILFANFYIQTYLKRTVKNTKVQHED